MTQDRKVVTIDFLPDSPLRHLDYDAVVCIDVIRATSTLVTAVAQGRRALPAPSVAAGLTLAASLENPLLAGEIGSSVPDGFELSNSPAAVAGRKDVSRPLVLVTPSGTPLLANAEGCRTVYVACFRNITATARWLAGHHQRIAILGAGHAGEPRCEDQMAAAWIAEQLVEHGFELQDMRTADIVRRWGGTSVTLAGWGNSAEYLRRSGQLADLEFILGHVDDLDLVCRFERGEVTGASRVPVIRLQAVRSSIPVRPRAETPAFPTQSSFVVRHPQAAQG
jgi:2-phosphosulfolactate phosphatase